MFCAQNVAAAVAVACNLVPLPADFLKSSEARVNFRPFQAPRNWSRWGGGVPQRRKMIPERKMKRT